MTDPAAIDAYIADTLGLHDPLLDDVNRRAAERGLPEIQVSAAYGRFLQFLCRSIGSTRVLEIGTLAGYSAIQLARALPTGGELITLEVDPAHAALATENIREAGLADIATVLLGPASETLDGMVTSRPASFDFVFIDADKESYPDYLEQCIKLCRPGALIVADNVVRGGRVIAPSPSDVSAVGTAEFNRLIGADPRIEASIIQTVGQKGHDGLALLRVL